MLDRLVLVIRWLRALCRLRGDLALENLALRQHLTILSDIGCHATLRQPWIQRENWQFETHRVKDKDENATGTHPE
jgi:hypothetical protein